MYSVTSKVTKLQYQLSKVTVCRQGDLRTATFKCNDELYALVNSAAHRRNVVARMAVDDDEGGTLSFMVLADSIRMCIRCENEECESITFELCNMILEYNGEMLSIIGCETEEAVKPWIQVLTGVHNINGVVFTNYGNTYQIEEEEPYSLASELSRYKCFPEQYVMEPMDYAACTKIGLAMYHSYNSRTALSDGQEHNLLTMVCDEYATWHADGKYVVVDNQGTIIDAVLGTMPMRYVEPAIEIRFGGQTEYMHLGCWSMPARFSSDVLKEFVESLIKDWIPVFNIAQGLGGKEHMFLVNPPASMVRATFAFTGGYVQYHTHTVSEFTRTCPPQVIRVILRDPERCTVPFGYKHGDWRIVQCRIGLYKHMHKRKVPTPQLVFNDEE